MQIALHFFRVAKNTQVNIRFDDSTAADLEKVAAGLGISVSALVRHATQILIDEVKQSGSLRMKSGSVPEVKADARSQWGERKISLDSSRGVILNDEIAETPPPARSRVVYGKKRTKS